MYTDTVDKKEVEQSEVTQEIVHNDEQISASESDAVLDDYQQISNYKDVLFNDLMGDYDERGEYSINDDILQDLIDMPKKIDFVDEAGIHARGFLGDHIFSFLVTAPVKTDKGDAYCYLKLDEQVDRMAGFRYDVVTSVIATYCYRYDELFDQYMRDVFHLREYEGDNTGEEGRQYRAEYIANRYELLYATRACSEDYYEKLEEIYFNHRIMMLSMDPELMAIMAEFNKKRVKLDPYLIISKRRFYFLNQLLDEVLQLQNERIKKSEIAEKMDLLDAKYIEKSVMIKQKAQENPKVVALMPKSSSDNLAQNLSGKRATQPKPGVSKGGGTKPKSSAKAKGKKGKAGGKKGGKKPNKPKTQMKAWTKPMPDLVITSFSDTIKDIAKKQFGEMQM